MSCSRTKSPSDWYPRRNQCARIASLNSIGTKVLTVSVHLPQPEVVGREVVSDSDWAAASVECMLVRVRRWTVSEYLRRIGDLGVS